MKKTYIKNTSFPCSHAFSTRLGGVSSAPFDSLNLSFVCGDNKENVIKNWNRFSRDSNIPINHLAITNQIHKPYVAIVNSTHTNLPGNLMAYKNCDGLVSNENNITLAVMTADCAPLLLCDNNIGVIGALHCGWKPFVADIIKEGISKMIILGAKRENIYACIGPCINQCCFETGPEVSKAFDSLLNNDSKKCYKLTNKHTNKYNVNLRLGVQTRLEQLGISYRNIYHVNECTKCNVKKYFSYRAEGAKTGRLAHIIYQ